ncbi:MAG: PKD domain-containing protein [Candidatus Thermoplasmatota archaeon]|nr:PKD domain-containing protein [Candidatus Thermoplasmatota archaeon]
MRQDREGSRSRDGKIRGSDRRRESYDRSFERKGRRDRERPGDVAPGNKGIPKAFIVPIAVMIVLILLIASVLLLINSGSSLDSALVGNIERRSMDGDLYQDNYPETLYIPFYASSSGFGKPKGTLTLEIRYSVDQTLLHTEKVEIDGEIGHTYVHMNRFVKGNGDYTFTARVGGSSNSVTFTIYEVVEKLSVVWEHGINDTPFSTHSYSVDYTVTPLNKDGQSLLRAPMPYDLKGALSKPQGDADIIERDWPQTGSYIITGGTEHTIKGNYDLDLQWTNLMCRADSPYYKVSLSEGSSIPVDSPPYADAGEDQEVALTGGAATVSFDGSGSEDDWSIVEYRWDFGDGQNFTSATPYASHTYNATGDYFVTLVVVDDSGQTSTSRWGGDMMVTVIE